MSLPVPSKVQYRAVAEEAFAAGHPVSSHIGATLQRQISHFYEALYDEALPGKNTAIVTGHDHAGGGTGRSIPREVFAQTWALPLGDAAGSHSASEYDYNEGSIDGAAWVCGSGMANVHATPGWVQGTGADADRFNLVAACPFRLRAGCKGVAVRLWRGTHLPGDATSAESVTWRAELRALMAGTTGSSDTRDQVVAVVSSPEAAAWVDFPDGTTTTGTRSGGAWLAATESPGDRLTVDTDFVLYIGVKPSTDAAPSGGDAPSGAGLFAALIYEVPAEN